MENKTIQIKYKNSYYNFCYTKTHKNSKFIVENHFHNEFEIIIVLNGSISGIINDKTYKMKNGLLIIPPFTYHNIISAADTEYERITLLFDKKLIPKDIRNSFIDDIKDNLIISNETCQTLSKRMLSLFEPKFEKYEQLFLMTIQEIFYYSLLEKNDYNTIYGNEQIEAIITYISNNLEGKLSLDEIANQVFLSKSSICHLFKAHMNISIKQYILQKKIARASYLINAGMQPKEVAYKLGYENYANFFKIYKKITGKAPSAT